MNNKIKQLLKITKSFTDSSDLTSVHQTLKEIKKLLILSILKDEIADIGNLLNDDQPQDKQENTKQPKNREQTLESLEEIATIQKDGNGNRIFLLHRPTENFEYGENAENVEYETSKVSEWYAEYMSGEENQEGANPVVSCWIPEGGILGSEKPHENTGTWGDLGENPFADKFKVLVKPGKYRIYQELRQRG